MPVVSFKPYWTSPDGRTVKLYLGHVIDVLARLPAASVHCCVTSPPYWSLRSYSTCEKCGKHLTAAICRECKHVNKGYDYFKSKELGSEPSPDCGTQGQAQCSACFVCSMVAVFRGVHRVLRDDGVLWLNLGDSYEPSGNLVGAPWRVALALQSDGWVLRSDIPWIKRSAMPESADNRPTKALEYVFLLTKGMGYFFDMEAVRKKNSLGSAERFGLTEAGQTKKWNSSNNKRDGRSDGTKSNERLREFIPLGRAFRNSDLWFQSIEPPHGVTGMDEELVGLDVTSQGYAGAHFATYPERLIEPLILAGTSAKGCCGDCGAPWEREGKGWQPTCECHGRFETQEVWVDRPISADDPNNRDRSMTRNRNGVTGSLDGLARKTEKVKVAKRVYVPQVSIERHSVQPCTVLDPFIGSGTTCVVAARHGRHSIGIDLSEAYLSENAIARIVESNVARFGRMEQPEAKEIKW